MGNFDFGSEFGTFGVSTDGEEGAENLFTQSMQLQCAKSFYQFALDKSSLKPTLLVGS